MNLHLAEIATQIAPGAHAALLIDQAGWHLSGRLDVPPNITLISLPAKCPELNPQENVWQFMRDNWLSNRVLQILRRHRQPLLRRLEQARRSALENHLHRNARLGVWVLISEFLVLAPLPDCRSAFQAIDRDSLREEQSYDCGGASPARRLLAQCLDIF